ncbi:MAG: PAS domain-containing protein [Aquificales bacterium]|nr:PAS domain-containing protein [Aquificales bacterium]
MKKKRAQFVNVIRTLSIISLVTLAASIMLFQIAIRYREFNQRTEQMRANYIAQQRAMIKREVERVVETIQYHRSLSEQQTEKIVQQQVYAAYDIAQNIYQQNQTTHTDTEIQQMIVDALRPIRFNQGNGYYFIMRLDGTQLLLADKPEMEGLNLLEIQDANGNYVVKDMIGIAKQTGEGFHDYYWTKPDTEGNDHKKVSFIKQFEPYDWFIGTSLYVDDVEEQLKTDLLPFISDIQFGTDGYIFVGQWDGLSLAGPGTGQNVIDIEDADGMKVVRALINTAAAGGGYVDYRMPSVSNKENELKTSYTQGIDEWQWYVGAGVYIDDVEADIAELQAALTQKLRTEIQTTILITGVMILLLLLLFHLISRRLLNDLDLFVTFFNQAAHEDKEIDRKLVKFEELYLMAGDANTMLRDKIAAQRNLLEEKEQLNVTLRSIGDGVITTDTDGKVVLMNRAAEALTGWQEAEAVDRYLAEIFVIVNEYSRQSIENPVKKGERYILGTPS